jgi:hypothetical protein
MEWLYIVFYCMVKDDGTNTMNSRVLYLLEVFLTLCFLSFSMIILGALNIRFVNFYNYIFILLPCPILAYIIVKSRFRKTSYQRKIQNLPNLILKKKRFFTFLSICLFIGVFVFLFFSGMLMSYFFSLHM